MDRHEGRVAIVTGAAAGIGAACARRLAAGGAKLCIVDRDEEGGEAVRRELGDAAIFVAADVGSDADVKHFVARTVEAFGRLDILVNNVSGGAGGKVTEVSEEAWLRATDLTLFSMVRACRHAIPHVTKGTGAIVNIASTAGLRGQYNLACYATAKAAVLNLTRSIALDHVADGIRVNAVCPGVIETAATARIGAASPELWNAYLDRIPMRRAGQASEVANAVSFLASDEASYITGTTLVVDGGNTAWSGQPIASDYLGRA